MRTLAVGVSVGSVLVLVGALAIGLVPPMVHDGIRDLMKMETPSSPLYESFKNSSAKGVEVYKTFYFFDVKNPENVSYGNGEKGAAFKTVKPQVELVGPFTVREYETYNESVSRWLPNATFRYRSFTTYEMVSGDFNTNVTIPHLSLFAFHKALLLADRVLADGDPKKEAWLNFLLSADAAFKHGVDLTPRGMFINRSVKDILFGFNDTLSDFMDATFKRKAEDLALNANTIPSDYATGDAENECYTGGTASNTSPGVPENSYRWMTMWHSMRVADYWGTLEANTVGGTDATAFHPFIKKGEAVLVWVNSLLRKVILSFQKEVVHRGITTYRHIIDPTELDPTVQANIDGYGMWAKGWLPSPNNETSQPVNFTKALFLDADMSLVDVDGIPKWSRDARETTLDIEPLTGTLVNVNKRIQVNVDLNRFAIEFINASLAPQVEAMQAFKDVHKTYLPVFFLNEHMSLPDKIVDDLKKSIFIPLLLAKVLGGLSVAVGLAMIIAAVVVRILAVRREERNYQSHEFYLVNDEPSQS